MKLVFPSWTWLVITLQLTVCRFSSFSLMYDWKRFLNIRIGASIKLLQVLLNKIEKIKSCKNILIHLFQKLSLMCFFLKVLFQKENSLGIPNTQERKKRKKKKKKKCITDTGYTEVKVNLFFSF